jgi:hypothetical protein
MIIFNLDGTLANCEHRRHFVQAPDEDGDENYDRYYSPDHEMSDRRKKMIFKHKVTGEIWQPHWPAFYAACDLDEPIEAVLSTFIHLTQGEPFNHDVQIWSGRCESVRQKTLKWLVNLTGYCEDYQYWDRRLKMRPIGDNTPDDVLKEKWLQELLQESMQNCLDGKKLWHKGIEEIDFVFDSDPTSIAMWRRRGIFVFNCAQSENEF